MSAVTAGEIIQQAETFTAVQSPYDDRSVVDKSASEVESLLIKLKNLSASLLISIGFVEPPLLPGMTRIRWQCVSYDIVRTQTIREM